MSTKYLASSLVLLLSLNTSILFAVDSFEDDLGGFDTDEVNETDADLAGFGSKENGLEESSLSTDSSQQDSEEKKSMWNISGNVAFKTVYAYKEHQVDGVDYKGFNQAQISTYLQLDAKLSDDWKMRISGDAFYDAIYDIRDENYNDATLNAYQTQLRFDDVYIQGRLSSDIDLKVGRQIVVWGKSDSIRITDVINPLDNRLPAMTDIEDLRLPTSMAKLDYYVGQWNLSAMLIAESRIFLEAAPYGEYFPVSNIFPNSPKPFFDLNQPKNSFENMQYAFAANGVFSGWDLSFYGADVYDSKWHLEIVDNKPQRIVSKIKMLGSAINIVTGSWLLKSELAYVSGVRYNSTDDAKDRVDLLVGVDYMGVKDTVMSLELALKHIYDYEQQMGSLTSPKPDYVNENEYQTAMRLTRSFANDSINASALLSMFGGSWEYGGFARVWLEYDVVDAVIANVGVVDYIEGDRPFSSAIKDNDRVFADITYSF